MIAGRHGSRQRRRRLDAPLQQRGIRFGFGQHISVVVFNPCDKLILAAVLGGNVIRIAQVGVRNPDPEVGIFAQAGNRRAELLVNLVGLAVAVVAHFHERDLQRQILPPMAIEPDLQRVGRAGGCSDGIGLTPAVGVNHGRRVGDLHNRRMNLVQVFSHDLVAAQCDARHFYFVQAPEQ